MSSPPSTSQRALRLVAYILVSVGTIGMHYAYGAVYVQMLDALGGTREITALVGSLALFMMDGMGLLSGRIVQRFGSRRCALAGDDRPAARGTSDANSTHRPLMARAT